MTSIEEEQTNSVRNQGRENGLFRKCMDTIKQSHTIGQGLRTAALAPLRTAFNFQPHFLYMYNNSYPVPYV